jgi:hypothetical protein
MSKVSGSVAAFLLVSCPLAAQTDPGGTAGTAARAAALFDSHDLVTLRLSGPFRDLLRMRNREDREWLDATLTVTDGAGEAKTVPIRFSTRGRFRLQREVCQFPPIRVDFRESPTTGTVFEGQDQLKLVTHCQDRRADFEQYALQEYLLYRMYNLFTDMSFRVRLARITYVDAENDRELSTRYAFFIEAEDRMAARNGWELLEHFPIVPPDQQDPEALIRVPVFQYMIGNTDWSAFQAPPGEAQCCHNVRIIGSPSPPVFPVPYDFDWSGIINAPYARPNPILPIRSVRERLYRGVCRPTEEVEKTLAVFRQQREAIFGLVDGQEGLTDRKRADMRKYLEEFYTIIDNPRQVERRMVRDCVRA